MGDVYMVNGKILSGLPNHAKDIVFDNTGTTLSSTNTEDAIKEVNSKIIKSVTVDVSGQVIATPDTNMYTGRKVVPDIPSSAIPVAAHFINGGYTGASVNVFWSTNIGYCIIFISPISTTIPNGMEVEFLYI